MNQISKHLKIWYSSRKKINIFFIVIGIIALPFVTIPLLIIDIIFRENQNDDIFNKFWYVPIVLTFGIFVFEAFEANYSEGGLYIIFFPLMGILSLTMLIKKTRNNWLKLFSKIYKDKKSFNLKVIYAFMIPISFLCFAYMVDIITYKPSSSYLQSSSSKYAGYHNGYWEGFILNQYNSGSATFNVTSNGSATLSLSGSKNATHSGRVVGSKLIINNNQSCSIIDQGGGSFKIVLIWTGVNVDAIF